MVHPVDAYFYVEKMDMNPQKGIDEDFRYKRNMSTSILYHGFGLVGYNYVKAQYQGNAIIFTISHKREKLYCPACKSREVILRGTTKRRFKAFRLGFKVIYLELEFQRVGCLACDSIRQVPLGFADPRFSYTRAFERYALELFANSGDITLNPSLLNRSTSSVKLNTIQSDQHDCSNISFVSN